MTLDSIALNSMASNNRKSSGIHGEATVSEDKLDVSAAFPGAKESTYLSTCTRGLLPAASRDALVKHLDELTTGRIDKMGLFDMLEDVRAKFATLINASADEVTTTKNVSEGLNIVAASLPLKAGDNIVVTFSLEHPNNVYPWLNQKALRGVEVRSIPDKDGRIDLDAMLAAIDDRTKVVTMPSVTFSPGFKTDVRRMGEVCRKRDIFLMIDAVQSVGVLHTDVEDMLIDGLAVSTQKGLCGLYGFGFLYCRRDWAERMAPPYLARFSVDLGDGVHEAALGDSNYALMPGARRFDVGNYNYPAAIVAQQSMKILLDIGTPTIERHVLGLAHRLVDGMLALDLPVKGGAPGPDISHIVSVGHMAEGHDTTQDTSMLELSEFLMERNIIHSIRRGMLRFAMHVYNTPEDIERVLALSGEWCKANRAA